MNTKNSIPVLLLLSLLLASCLPQRDSNTDIAVIVALTQTAAAQQNPASPETTPPPAALKGYQPYVTEECNALSNSLSSVYGFPGEVVLPVPFEDYVNSASGLGCKITFARTGETISGLDVFMNSTTPAMQGLGWQPDMAYGASGAGGMSLAYRKNDTICLTTFQMKEIDPTLCPGNEPISACWGRLAPEQLAYSATFNCSTYYP